MQAYLAWLLPKIVPEGHEGELLIKFSVDNARMMNRGTSREEAAGFDILREGQTIASVKSPDNCHLWAMYVGRETVTELDTELAQGFRAIEKLNGKWKL